jgi:hypothetical protein
LFLVGAFTRIVAFIRSGEMAFAYFMAHAPRSFYPLVNGGELAVIYCFHIPLLRLCGRRSVERRPCGAEPGLAGKPLGAAVEEAASHLTGGVRRAS